MTPKIDTVAIYAARNAVRAGAPAEPRLPEPRSEECRQACLAADSSTPELCDLTACWAHRISAKVGRPRPPIRVDRGRQPAARPRSFAQIARDCYGAGPTEEHRLIQTSGRGGR